MLDFELLQSAGVVRLHPETPLLAREFAQLSETVNRYLANQNELKGIIIGTEDPLGWEDLSELVNHLVFSNDQHKHLPKLAALSDTSIDGILAAIGNHFSGAEIRIFNSGSEEKALEGGQS